MLAVPGITRRRYWQVNINKTLSIHVGLKGINKILLKHATSSLS